MKRKEIWLNCFSPSRHKFIAPHQYMKNAQVIPQHGLHNNLTLIFKRSLSFLSPLYFGRCTFTPCPSPGLSVTLLHYCTFRDTVPPNPMCRMGNHLWQSCSKIKRRIQHARQLALRKELLRDKNDRTYCEALPKASWPNQQFHHKRDKQLKFLPRSLTTQTTSALKC